jgi:4-aminobutyrate aminotransferase-like enzyme
LAGFEVLLQLANSEGASHSFGAVLQQEQLFRQHLQHPAIQAIHGRGLLLAVEFASPALCQRICHAAVQAGLVTDWFLFAPHCLRIAPPLVMSAAQIEEVCQLLLSVIAAVASDSAASH